MCRRRSARRTGEVAVDAGHDGAEHRDAERGAEFVRRLGDRGGGARLFLGHAGEDHVGGHGEGEPGADADDQQGRAEQRVAGVLPDDGQRGERETDGAETARDHGTDREAPGRAARDQTRHHRADGGRQLGQSRLEGPPALDELQVLGEEEHQPRQAQDGQQVGQDRPAEAPAAEQPHVEQRPRHRQLAAHEPVERGGAQQARGERGPHEPVRGGLLDGVHDTDHADQGEGDAQQVPRAGVGVAGLGQQLRADDDQDGHHGQVDQEDRAPPEVLQQEPADDRADRRTGGGGGAPDADGEAAFARVVEEVPDQGEGGGHQGGARDAEQRPGEDHQLGRVRVGVEHGYRAERRGAHEQDPLAADAVAEAAHGDEQTGDDEGVDVADPEQLGAGRGEVLTDVGGRETEHGRVDGHQQHGQHEDGQRQPAAGALHRLGRVCRLQGAGHDPSLRSAPPSSSSTIMWVKSLRATRPSVTAQAPAPIRP